MSTTTETSSFYISSLCASMLTILFLFGPFRCIDDVGNHLYVLNFVSTTISFNILMSKTDIFLETYSNGMNGKLQELKIDQTKTATRKAMRQILLGKRQSLIARFPTTGAKKNYT